MSITESNVVGWWDMEEGTGSTLGDESTNNISMTISGATWTTGGPTNLSNGLNFVAASSQYAATNNNYDTFSDGSLALWAIIDDKTLSPVVLLGDGGLGGGGNADVFLESSELKGRTRMTGDATIAWSSVANATLYHIVYTWKSGTGVELFINGSSVGSTANTGSTGAGTTEFTMAAQDTGSFIRFFDGKIFQACYFNAVLDSTDISNLYNSGNGKKYGEFFGGGVATTTPTLLTMGVG